jgi:hypothetical protein
MKTDPVWMMLLAVVLAGVAACALLGGQVKSPVVNPDCPQCPDGYDCPPISNPGGQCEAHDGISPQWGARHAIGACLDVDHQRCDGGQCRIPVVACGDADVDTR